MSRLRNRIRKAEYFTDGELLRWHRDKRATYSGLWAIAEDSGCLEDDPFAWKLAVWASPLDADITVEKLEQWRDELIAAGKLLPYEANGKRYLFIRNFHKHESPRNPQRPDLPLPPWVSHRREKHSRKDGGHNIVNTYIVDESVAPTCHRFGTESVPTPPSRPVPSRPEGVKGRDGSSAAAPDERRPRCFRCGELLTADEQMDAADYVDGEGWVHHRCRGAA